MLIRGVTLEGSIEGIKYFLIPKWEDLLKPSVWANAAIQNFNSIGVAFGGLISMSSYNPKNKKIFGYFFLKFFHSYYNIGCNKSESNVYCSVHTLVQFRLLQLKKN
jgi:hypothetical protein